MPSFVHAAGLMLRGAGALVHAGPLFNLLLSGVNPMTNKQKIAIQNKIVELLTKLNVYNEHANYHAAMLAGIHKAGDEAMRQLNELKAKLKA